MLVLRLAAQKATWRCPEDDRRPTKNGVLTHLNLPLLTPPTTSSRLSMWFPRGGVHGSFSSPVGGEGLRDLSFSGRMAGPEAKRGCLYMDATGYANARRVLPRKPIGRPLLDVAVSVSRAAAVPSSIAEVSRFQRMSSFVV